MTRLCLILIASLLAAPAWGQGKEKPIVVGLFLPALPDASRAARVKAVEDLASHLAAKIGHPVKGRSFARAADLADAVKQRLVHFAIVDAPYLAERRWSPLATLDFHGSTSGPWQFLAKAAVSNIGELRGKVLAFPAMSKADRQFIANVLLEGEVAPSYFGWSASPDASSAIRAVALGKAFATVAPAQRSTGGLSTVFVSREVPAPAMVHVGRLPPKVEQSVLGALLSWQGSWLGYDGWKAADAAAYERLSTALLSSGDEKRPVAPRPAPFVLQPREVFTRFQPSLELPSVLDLLEAPTANPDLAPSTP